MLDIACVAGLLMVSSPESKYETYYQPDMIALRVFDDQIRITQSGGVLNWYERSKDPKVKAEELDFLLEEIAFCGKDVGYDYDDGLDRDY